MIHQITETNYPPRFRKQDVKKLSQQINKRRNVVLIGMKRVGISNFLRFFLYHPGISETYLNSDKHIFVPVDLNDLVEREIYPFWVLTFKRISDSIEKSGLPNEVKNQIEAYFLDSIQSQDLFLTIDNLRKSLVFLTEKGYLPTLFLIRFDRMKGALTPELFSNFQGLIDATHQKLSYVFTSDHSLDQLEPAVFNKQAVSVFSDKLFIKPAEKSDSKIIFDSSIKQYNLKLKSDLSKQLLKFVDGHTQYLLFALISISENPSEIKPVELFDFLKNDERIALQSEELWETLSQREQEILIKVLEKQELSSDEIKDASYLINTGFFDLENYEIFNSIFTYFVKIKNEEMKKDRSATELSKKEHLLLSFLETKKNDVCEREEIIDAVWPEAESLGVTDWAIDRLIARVRTKLLEYNNNYEIVTVKTRGYKLINKEQ